MDVKWIGNDTGEPTTRSSKDPTQFQFTPIWSLRWIPSLSLQLDAGPVPRSTELSTFRPSPSQKRVTVFPRTGQFPFWNDSGPTLGPLQDGRVSTNEPDAATADGRLSDLAGSAPGGDLAGSAPEAARPQAG